MIDNKNRRAARLWYLVSINNLEYINNYYKLNVSKEYQPILGISHTPSFVLKNSFFKYAYIVSSSLVLFFRLLKKYISSIKERGKNSPKAVKEENIFLIAGGTSPLPRLLEHAGIDSSKGFWLCPRGCKLKNIPGDKVLQSLSLLEKKQIKWCFYDVIRSFFTIGRRKGFSFSLAVNGGFEWLIMYWSLQNLSPNAVLYFCQQYHQSVIAIGKAPQKRKIHLQHGTMVIRNNIKGIQYPVMQYLEDYDCWTMNSPFKMSNVEMVYAFSEREFAAECKAIFKDVPKLSVVGYNLRKQDLFEVDKKRKSVLIVAFYRTYKDIEIELVKELNKLNVDIYIKIHPGDKIEWYEDLKKQYNCRILTGREFPNTDLVLSYESTLALEYEDLGTEVLYFHSDPLDTVMAKTKKKLFI